MSAMPGAEPMGEERPARRPRRGLYVLPSLLTAGNIATGFFAVTESFRGAAGHQEAFDHAALAIGFAVLFDGLDGRVARMTRTTSEFGKELDSLADVLTFGMAPAILAYVWGFRMLPLETAYPYLRERMVPLGIVACFLFLICGACRLARFNISVNPQPRNPGRPGRKYFVGMPIPAGAGVIASVVHFERGSWITDPRLSLVWTVLLIATGLLMVSSWRFWSGKEVGAGTTKPARYFVLIAAMLALVVFFSEWALLVLALGYLVSGVLARLAYGFAMRRRLAQGGH